MATIEAVRNGVSSVNSRNGDVLLGSADIIAAGGATSASVAVLTNVNPVTYVPTSGQTVTITPTGANFLAYVVPAAPLLSLTINLANGSSPGQVVRLMFGNVVTTLAVTSTNILSALSIPSTAAIGLTFQFHWDAGQSKWIRGQ